jgi:hypothetical protein
MKRALIALALVSAASVACTQEFSSDGLEKVAGGAGEAGDMAVAAAGAGQSSAGVGGAAHAGSSSSAGSAGRPVATTGGSSAGAAAGAGGAAGEEPGTGATGGSVVGSGGTAAGTGDAGGAGGSGGTAAAGGLGATGSGGSSAGTGGAAAGTGGSPEAGTGGTVTPPSCTAEEALKISALPTTFELPAWSETTDGQCFKANAGSCSYAVDAFGPYGNNTVGRLMISAIVCDTSPKAGTCGSEKSCGGSMTFSVSGVPFNGIVPDGDGYRLSDFVVGDQFGGPARAGTCSYDIGDAYQHAFQQALADMLASVRFACH